MVKKLILHFWSLRKEFARYFIIGVSGVVLDIGSLYAFKEFLHLHPITAVIINQFFLINYVFFLNKRWAFRAKGVTRQQMVRFFILSGFNYAFSVAWMWAGNHRLEFNYLLVRLSNIILAVAWNFLLYKYWVYRESPQHDNTPTPQHDNRSVL